MKKCTWLMGLLCLCALFLSGCGEAKLPDVIQAPTVAVDREGKVAVWLLGDFDKSYYSIPELTDMAVSEAAQYCAAKKRDGAAVVEKVENVQGSSTRVIVSYRFDSCDSCSEFLGNVFFYGTVEEAIRKGYSTDVIMRDVDDNSLFTESQLRQAGDRYLVITDMNSNIYCPAVVTHISNGALLNEDGSINPSAADGLVYILMK